MRKHYLDNIRWITIVLVVIYHVIYMYNAEKIPGVVGNITGLKVQYYDVYQYLVYPWFMFLLFLVSGISARSYLEHHTEKEFLKSRTTKLLVPSTLGLFAFQFVQGYFNAQMNPLGEMMHKLPWPAVYGIMVVSGIGVLWFIQLLWVLSLLLLSIRRLEKDRLWEAGSRVNMPVLLLMTIAVFGAAQILNTPIVSVYRFGYYGLAYLLGYFVFSHDEVIQLLKKWFLPLLAGAIVLGLGFGIHYFGNNYADAPVYQTPLFTSFGWFASLAFLGGAAAHLDFTNRFTSWMSSHSWGLYVFHYLGISMVAVWIAKRHLLPAGFVYLLSLFAAFALAFPLYAVIKRIPYLRWVVLGETKS